MTKSFPKKLSCNFFLWTLTETSGLVLREERHDSDVRKLLFWAGNL